jgi:hypothetical protein
MTTRAPWTPSPDLLDELALALRADGTTEHTTFLDVATKQVIVLTVDPDHPLRAPADDAPAWRKDEHALARQVADDPDRFRRVVGHGTPGRLRAFLDTVTDRALRDALEDAAHGGRGAYRRVREVLRRRGAEERWHAFEAAADRELALAWLRSEGLLSSPRAGPRTT